MTKLVSLGGRILLSAIFLISGLGKITNFAGTQQYMASHEMPYTAFFLVGAIILEIGGGLSVLLGCRAKWGALALIVFLIPATLVFHTNFSDRGQVIHFMKNLAILGGLLMVVQYGSGPISIDKTGGQGEDSHQ